MPVLLLFATLFVLSIADTAIRFTLYRRLRERHPAKYDAMDRPSIFWIRFSSAWALLWFLVVREHTLLRDRTTTHLADVLLALRVATVFAASGLAIAIAAAHQSA
ncbi:hypothetical protein [Noviluteimonas dokdonensis]|uniref:hypothetical protein n=1 Tax=Noviluteimonas dokdonensis TaxID=414050 RepID=UPI00056AC8F6|nr:hypothetical protein [Lysobacter dokdonensis]